MKKIQSKKLWQYLCDSGALNGTAEDISNAKLEYLRLYKKVWKQNRIPKKEMRPAFTLEEYQQIKIKAQESRMYPTVFVRQTVIARIYDKDNVVDKEALLLILQKLSMAITNSKAILPINNFQQLLLAEKQFIEYLNKV